MTPDEGTFSIRANYDKLKQDAESEAMSWEDGTDKVRESYGNHDRTGRSGLPANLDTSGSTAMLRRAAAGSAAVEHLSGAGLSRYPLLRVELQHGSGRFQPQRPS